jgi:transcriptional regulator with XRE-family HTH domain
MGTLGERVREARERLKLTQEQLASRARVSQGTIANLESGYRARPRNLLLLAEALGVTPQWLERGEHSVTEPSRAFVLQTGDGELSTAHPVRERSPLDTPATEGGADWFRPDAYIVAPMLLWSALLRDADIPQSFRMTAPDDALAPGIPRDTVLLFERHAGARLEPGDGVLVRALDGSMHLRMYAQGPAGGWTAAATHPAYASLDSARDGLAVVAVMTGRMGRKV